MKIVQIFNENLTLQALKGILSKEICIESFSQNGFHPSVAKQGAKFCVDWIFLCDTLNFCFWTPQDKVKWSVDNETGYFALCNALNRALKEGYDITNPKYYAELSEADAKHIFRSDSGETEIPLLQERIKCLHETGRVLLEKYDGTFVNCIKKANKSAKVLLQLIVQEFSCFRDEATYNGLKVAIYKRAQILVGDTWACFQGEDYGEFTDISDSITMFADYRIPQVLILFGALDYSRQLMDILDSSKFFPSKIWSNLTKPFPFLDILIPNGSEYEVEIRGASIHAIEMVKDRLLARMAKEHPELSTKFVNSILLDHFLWDYRRKHNKTLEEKNIQFHKTICVYY